ncbi:Creg1 [Symbiodinium sp. CCMP2592]|nr:Creg1 [Symbiodinium sp. CCMP2592]
MPPSMEIRALAAEVSWKLAASKVTHPVYQKVPHGYRILRRDPGPASPDTAFDSACDVFPPEVILDRFWMLERCCRCQTIVAQLLRQVHLSCADPDTQELFTTSMYNTATSQEAVASMPLKVQQLLGIAAGMPAAELERFRHLAEHLSIPIDGPALVVSCRQRAPVYSIETEATSLLPSPLEHKLQLSRMVDEPFNSEEGQRIARFPVEFLPFSNEKLNPEVTATDEMLRRHIQFLMHDKPVLDSLVDSIFLIVAEQDIKAKRHSPSAVRLSGIEKRPALNGSAARVVMVVEDRVAVALETGEKIKLLPSKLKFDSGTARQCLTLKEMKQELDDACRESTPPAPLKADAKAMNRIRAYFSNDAHGQIFFARVIQAGNVGLTNVTDPELLPAFRTVVRLRVAQVLMGSPAQQRQWESILRLSERKEFPEFRQLILTLRGGLGPEEFVKRLAEKPAFEEMYEVAWKPVGEHHEHHWGPIGAGERASGASLGRRGTWHVVSAHEEGSPDGYGRRVHRKWRPRASFGLACAPARGGYLLYVAGGEDASGHRLSDVWASQDGGAHWRCMAQDAPFGARASPALAAVPKRPERVILCGGMAASAELCLDVWVSEDAGYSWSQLDRPPWAHITGRFRSALLPLPPAAGETAEFSQTANVLLVGGCFIDGGDGAYGGFERLMHDVWEGRVNFGKKAAEWRSWGTQTDDRGRPWAKLGVDNASCASDGRRLVALLPGRPAVSETPLQRPTTEVESLQWRASQEATTLPRALGAAWGKSISAFDGPSQCTLRIATSRNSLPRLLLAFPEGLLVSGPAEWRRQLIFLLLLGLRLSNRYQLPEEIWRRKVLPGVLPAIPQSA